VSGGVLPRRATTTAADPKRDARAALRQSCERSAIARRSTEEERAEALSSASDDGGGIKARCASSSKAAKVSRVITRR
jgi:hypothetical protein